MRPVSEQFYDDDDGDDAEPETVHSSASPSDEETEESELKARMFSLHPMYLLTLMPPPATADRGRKIESRKQGLKEQRRCGT